MKLTTGLTGLAAAALLVVSGQSAAIANPFGNIMNSVNDVNETVNDVNNTINTVEQTVQTVNTLSNLLGVDSGLSSSISSSDPTGQIMELYGVWFSDLSSSEQETAAWLITQYALDQSVSLDTIATTAWFLQKSQSEQSQVADTFSKIQQLLAASDQDSSRFLGYASCLSAGMTNCLI